MPGIFPSVVVDRSISVCRSVPESDNPPTDVDRRSGTGTGSTLVLVVDEDREVAWRCHRCARVVAATGGVHECVVRRSDHCGRCTRNGRLDAVTVPVEPVTARLDTHQRGVVTGLCMLTDY